MNQKALRLLCAVLVLSVISFTTSTAIAKPSASVQRAAPALTTNITYVVQRGDTLNRIAVKYCTTWRSIYNLNYYEIGPNPNLIYPGMVLVVPAECNEGTEPPPTTTPPPTGVYDRGPMLHANGTFNNPYYTVTYGDWLAYIGQRFGVSWQSIYSANGLTSTVIYAGQKLLIPSIAIQTPEPPTPTPVPGSTERVNFAYGATSATRTGTISNGVPKTYVLKALAGQTMYVSGVSDAEALTVSIKNASGQRLAVSGNNGVADFSVHAYLPGTVDYYVTFTPVTQPENAALTFDVTFTIP